MRFKFDHGRGHLNHAQQPGHMATMNQSVTFFTFPSLVDLF